MKKHTKIYLSALGDSMQEIFKPIPELNGKYEGSNYGRVRRLNKDPRCSEYKYLKLQTNKDGYIYVNPTVTYRKLVHRIVAQLFIENPNCYPFVNHIDMNRTNNHVDNLEWVTSKMNTDHANMNGKLGNMRYLVLDLETGIFYDSIKQLSDALGKGSKYLYIKIASMKDRYLLFDKQYRRNYEKAH